MAEQSNVQKFAEQLSNVQILVPREVNKKKITKAIYTREVVTIVGIKTTTSRFLPVSHEGYSNETYVDKLSLLGKDRAEFIGRKLKGIERRAHMSLFRQMVESQQKKGEKKPEPPKAEAEVTQNEGKKGWEEFFQTHFGSTCILPDQLCIACWNCFLFGGLDPGKGATFSRIRYFDTFSVEDAAECIQTDDSPEQMAIGNTIGEDLSKARSEASFHRYEYVKAGTRFPFITMIESPTLLDVCGYLAAVKLADQHGYGKYSANHGKFQTQFLAVSTGYPKFSVLDMLAWLSNGEIDVEKLQFDAASNTPVSLFQNDINQLEPKLALEFQEYVKALEIPFAGDTQPGKTSPKRGRKNQQSQQDQQGQQGV